VALYMLSQQKVDPVMWPCAECCNLLTCSPPPCSLSIAMKGLAEHEPSLRQQQQQQQQQEMQQNAECSLLAPRAVKRVGSPKEKQSRLPEDTGKHSSFQGGVGQFIGPSPSPCTSPSPFTSPSPCTSPSPESVQANSLLFSQYFPSAWSNRPHSSGHVANSSTYSSSFNNPSTNSKNLTGHSSKTRFPLNDSAEVGQTHSQKTLSKRHSYRQGNTSKEVLSDDVESRSKVLQLSNSTMRRIGPLGNQASVDYHRWEEVWILGVVNTTEPQLCEALASFLCEGLKFMNACENSVLCQA